MDDQQSALGSIKTNSSGREVQQFVVVGYDAKSFLESNTIFTEFVSPSVTFIKSVQEFDFDATELSTTLFIVRHFNTKTSCAQAGWSPLVNNETKGDVEATPEPTPFESLTSRKVSIVGATALLQSIRNLKGPEDSIKMVSPDRPLHNNAMQNIIFTLSGIASKSEAQQLLTLTRWMGAKSREDVNAKTTHLIAANPRGLKYRRAAEIGMTIMSTEWVSESFKLAQDDIDFSACLPDIIARYKLKPFQCLHMAFVGFKGDDIEELRELTTVNGGYVVDSDDEACTHIVLDAISGSDETSCQLPSGLSNPSGAHVVYKEWFWASLEMEGKASEDAYSVPQFKLQTRRSSKVRASTGYNSFCVLSPTLDYSRSPDSMFERRASKQHQQDTSFSEQPLNETQPNFKQISARHRACLELVQTERNYVRILDTIVNLFKLPLESPETGDPILPATDIKIIFGNIEPIYEVHKRMLAQLEELIDKDWKETNLVGRVFFSHSVELVKAYPPFVNFFEDTKKTIQVCDLKYPRFHAFLRKCQSKIECNRESLAEMIIRPVQRLPSISLILNELIKKTDDTNPDKVFLKEALESIKKVMNLINEDKRKTEGQIAMFDIVNSIEDCPPDLLSSMRKFICKVEARLLFMNNESEVIPSKSHKIILFVFSDMIEICKVRSLKRSNSNRAYVPLRRGANHLPTQNKKDYRHLDCLHLADVKKIYSKFSSPELNDAIVIQARPSLKYDKNFRYYPIILDTQSNNKENFVVQLESCLANLNELDLVYLRSDTVVSSDEVDFGFANYLVNQMEKSRLSRVLSIRPGLLSPSMKGLRHKYQSGAATCDEMA